MKRFALAYLAAALVAGACSSSSISTINSRIAKEMDLLYDGSYLFHRLDAGSFALARLHHGRGHSLTVIDTSLEQKWSTMLVDEGSDETRVLALVDIENRLTTILECTWKQEQRTAIIALGHDPATGTQVSRDVLLDERAAGGSDTNRSAFTFTSAYDSSWFVLYQRSYLQEGAKDEVTGMKLRTHTFDRRLQPLTSNHLTVPYTPPLTSLWATLAWGTSYISFGRDDRFHMLSIPGDGTLLHRSFDPRSGSSDSIGFAFDGVSIAKTGMTPGKGDIEIRSDGNISIALSAQAGFRKKQLPQLVLLSAILNPVSRTVVQTTVTRIDSNDLAGGTTNCVMIGHEDATIIALLAQHSYLRTAGSPIDWRDGIIVIMDSDHTASVMDRFDYYHPLGSTYLGIAPGSAILLHTHSGFSVFDSQKIAMRIYDLQQRELVAERQILKTGRFMLGNSFMPLPGNRFICGLGDGFSIRIILLELDDPEL